MMSTQKQKRLHCMFFGTKIITYFLNVGFDLVTEILLMLKLYSHEILFIQYYDQHDYKSQKQT